MKLLLLLLLLPSVGIAQITVTDADFGTAGDTVRISYATDPQIDFASTGTNFNWDFTALVADSQKLLNYYDIASASTLVELLFGNFAPSDYRASYFQEFDGLPIGQLAQFLPVNISNVEQFTRITTDSVATVGISIDVNGNQIPFRSDSIEKRYALPLNFGDNYVGHGYTEMDLNPFAEIIWRQHRTRTSAVDGWGSIDLPMGTFDVLRVKHTIDENDSLYQDLLGTGTPTWFGIDLPTAHIYEWIANGEKEPVLRIKTSEVGGMETVTGIQYRDNYDPMLAQLNESSDLVSAEVYPNPVKSELNIETEASEILYSIIDMNGAVVLSGNVSDATISVSELPAGSYTLLGQTNLGILRVPFVKE